MSSIDQQADSYRGSSSSPPDALPKFDILAIHPSPAHIEQALQAWDGIDLPNKTAVLVSSFGDIFFEAPDGIHVLSAQDGSLQKFAHNRTEFRRRLSFTGPEEFLFASLVSDARNAGLRLAPDECYDFITPLQQGGKRDIANVRKVNFVQKLNARAQWQHGDPSPVPPPKPFRPTLLVPVLLFFVPLLLLANPTSGASPALHAFAVFIGLIAGSVGGGFLAYLLTLGVVTGLLKRIIPLKVARWLGMGLGLMVWMNTTIRIWAWLLSGAHF